MGTKGIGETELGFPHGGNRWSGARPHVPPRCAITLCPLLLCFTHEGESGVLLFSVPLKQPSVHTGFGGAPLLVHGLSVRIQRAADVVVFAGGGPLDRSELLLDQLLELTPAEGLGFLPPPGTAVHHVSDGFDEPGHVGVELLVPRPPADGLRSHWKGGVGGG